MGQRHLAGKREDRTRRNDDTFGKLGPRSSPAHCLTKKFDGVSESKTTRRDDRDRACKFVVDFFLGGVLLDFVPFI